MSEKDRDAITTAADGLTDRELLAQCAELFEYLRRLALAGGAIKRNGVRVNKLKAIADEAREGRLWIEKHLAASGDE
jgi:hypothetical protein